MSALLEKLRQSNTEHTQRMADRYCQLLETGNANDADELQDLAVRLNKSLSDIDADMRVLASWRNTLARVTTATAEDVDNRAREAVAKLEAFRKETEAIIQQRAEEDRRLDQIERELVAKSRYTDSNRDQLKNLMRQHPVLLGGKSLPA